MTSEEGCPGLGLGKTCKDLGTPRTQLATYFQKLEIEDEYIPLKTQYKRLKAHEKDI